MTIWESLQKRIWNDGISGGTALEKARLDPLEQDLAKALYQLARDPEQLFAGAITRDIDGAEISAVVKWPDGVDGNYAGTASLSFPGSISSYTVTRVGSPTVTFTQPAVTRDPVSGLVTNRPEITVS